MSKRERKFIKYEQQQRSIGGWFDHHAGSAMASLCIEYMVYSDGGNGVDRDRDTKYVTNSEFTRSLNTHTHAYATHSNSQVFSFTPC